MQITKILLVLFLQIGLVSNLQARGERERRELLSIINDELKELNRLQKSTKKQNPVFLLRRAELFLEESKAYARKGKSNIFKS